MKLFREVSKEEFYKLSQLDRIEYRQKEDRINKKFSGSITLDLINSVFIFLGFYLLVIFGIYNISTAAAISLTSTLPEIIRIFILFSIVTIALDGIRIYVKVKLFKELYEEFFKLKLEVKNVKRK